MMLDVQMIALAFVNRLFALGVLVAFPSSLPLLVKQRVKEEMAAADGMY